MNMVDKLQEKKSYIAFVCSCRIIEKKMKPFFNSLRHFAFKSSGSLLMNLNEKKL